MTDRAGESDSAGPWWNADDAAFAGATPIFDDEQPSAPPPPDAGGESAPPPFTEAGSPVMEALRLASAVADWSRESGLSDTLRVLATDVAASLADSAVQTTEDTDEPAEMAEEARPQPTLRLIEPSAEQDTAGHATTCEYCPLCRGMDVMRTVQPQLAAGIAEAMASLTEALNLALAGLADNRRDQ